jgi:hypothetical protein
MKKIMFLIALIILLACPMSSYADTVEECTSTYLERWYDKPSGIPDVPPLQPANPSWEKSGNNSNNIYAEAEMKEEKGKCARAEKSSGDLCCENTTGTKLGYCPEGYPVYKDIRSEACPNGKCYKNTSDCMKAGLIGFCYTCSRCK